MRTTLKVFSVVFSEASVDFSLVTSLHRLISMEIGTDRVEHDGRFGVVLATKAVYPFSCANSCICRQPCGKEGGS